MRDFQRSILEHYRAHGRDLPWRRTRNPWRILVSEVMLQQTQASRVSPAWRLFLRAFPSPRRLAEAPDAELFGIWRGMGYWRRARFLKEAARQITEQRRFPRTPRDLERLPGIGPYTARAVACFAFGNPEAFIDTNIRRVYLHFFFPSASFSVSDRDILPLAQQAIDELPEGVGPREWHNALFDYGALVLKHKDINRKSRHYARQSRFEDSFRFWRSEVMRLLLEQGDRGASRQRIVLLFQEGSSLWRADDVLTSLLKDSLVKKRGETFFL